MVLSRYWFCCEAVRRWELVHWGNVQRSEVELGFQKVADESSDPMGLRGHCSQAGTRPTQGVILVEPVPLGGVRQVAIREHQPNESGRDPEGF